MGGGKTDLLCQFNKKYRSEEIKYIYNMKKKIYIHHSSSKCGFDVIGHTDQSLLHINLMHEYKFVFNKCCSPKTLINYLDLAHSHDNFIRAWSRSRAPAVQRLLAILNRKGGPPRAKAHGFTAFKFTKDENPCKLESEACQLLGTFNPTTLGGIYPSQRVFHYIFYG